jgi:hypothetical protein
MELVDKILNNKDKIQNFLDNLNCDNDKWFVFREWDLENPTLRNFSSKMSHFLMEKNSKKHRLRFLWIKFSEDMCYSHLIYKKSTVDDFMLEGKKYNKIENGYLKNNISIDPSLIDLFSDKRIYGVHYIEAFNGTPKHKDPWKYKNKYNNIIFYSNVPDNIELKIKGKKVDITSPMKTNFGYENHEYYFECKYSPLKVLHIDYEFP